MDRPNVAPRVEQEEVFLTWKAPARPYRAKNKEFMTVPLVIAFLIGLILIVAGEWMLIAVVAALVFAYYTWSAVPAEIAEYSITSRGFRVNGRLYEWNVFVQWWIETKWEHKLLCLLTPTEVVGQVVAPLGEMSEAKVTEVMKKMLLNEKPEMTQMDKAGKWLSEKFPLSKDAV